MLQTQRIPVPGRPALYAEINTVPTGLTFSVDWNDATIEWDEELHERLHGRLEAMELPSRIAALWSQRQGSFPPEADIVHGSTIGRARFVDAETAG